jgi:diguanylate cyclase (GGDEF)-like protein
MNRLELAHARAQRSGTPTAVLFLDIDNFKTVNDSLGHEAGDQLLHAVAERLQVCIRLGDTVARLGGDEFTILMEAVNCVADPIAVAERIKGELSSRFHVGSKELYATASIGIAFQTGASETFDSLLRNADAAMYEAKANGKSGYMLFDHSMNDHAAERLDLEVGLRFALERGELALKYQPLIDLETGDMVGAEALLRWNHPTRGEIAPGKFISIAEDTGLIVPIGYWVLEEACRQVARWTHGRSEFASFTMNINVSGKQLQRPDIVDRIRDILAETGANPANVKLEITETVMMTDMEANIERLHRLKTLGVKLAMDDFGTGYSCMANLDAFPLDTVKIDRAFIQRLTQSNEDSGQMVEAIIALSRALHLDVTGEGVETQHQMAQLRGLGCDTAQGFFFARPLTADALGNLIAAGPGVLEEARKAAESVSPETQARAA